MKFRSTVLDHLLERIPLTEPKQKLCLGPRLNTNMFIKNMTIGSTCTYPFGVELGGVEKNP
uniref:Uncharacterized protein n=1 Tax=Lepeophtheirus salmonis TaxID=72036 RepID=A0A0K2U168_LEPSM